MSDTSTDRQWEAFGRSDPYYGVLSIEEHRSARLTDAQRQAFMTTGDEHVRSVMQTIDRHVCPGFSPRRALDFGCGVGRLVVPLARIAGHVTGVDVSPSMLAEARRNCQARGLDNVELVVSDDALSAVTGTYDFVHSFIVIQHIPVTRGERLFERLVQCLASGGVGALQVTYSSADPHAALKHRVRRWLPGSRHLINLVKGRAWDAPEMLMHQYDVGRLLQVLRGVGITEVHVELTQHSADSGALLFFRKPFPTVAPANPSG